MADKYIPGRIYSGIVNGERRTLMCSAPDYFEGGVTTYYQGNVSDVRGPLVVLDLSEWSATNTEEIVLHLREDQDLSIGHEIADQIEKQTRPTLQVGIHAVTRGANARALLNWDGAYWLDQYGWRDDHQDWESIHFIGPAPEGSESATEPPDRDGEEL